MGFGRGGKTKNSERSEKGWSSKKHWTDESVEKKTATASNDLYEEEPDVKELARKYKGFLTKAVEEMRNNVFSGYYKKSEEKKNKDGRESEAKRELNAYKHSDAITFAALTWFWMDRLHAETPRRPRWLTSEIPSFSSHMGPRAFYRVIVEKENKYILMACHVNVHGFHRGDLRFVEVDDRTEVRGSESFSCFGNLILGDVVAVSELARKSNKPFESPNIFTLNHASECVWAVRKMSLLTRNYRNELLFAFLRNGTAIAKGFNEALNVLETSGISTDLNELRDKLFIGDAFIPEKVSCIYTRNHQSIHENALVAVSSKLSSYPNALATVLNFSPAEYETKLFEIGVKAFSAECPPSLFPDEIVETCALMGYAAANTIFNGRFDDRTFVMMDARHDEKLVRFSIPNPRERPTDGRWICGTRIKFHGCQAGDVDATIETVVSSLQCRQIRIAARVARDSPMFDFTKGPHVVKQRESDDKLLLEEGFFKNMPLDSNGRLIIETMYGGKAIQLKNMPEVEAFEFPSDPAIKLNYPQSEYVSMILSDTPLIVVSSPFGCGKSMTIMTAALEIYERNAEVSAFPKKQLLITQSNFAGVNLVDIARKIQKSDFPKLKFVRYVSEKNWKELPDNCRTEYDMPALMADVFASWAYGEKKSDVDARVMDRKHMKDAVKWLIRNGHAKPELFVGEARGIYEKIEANGKKEGKMVQTPCSSAFLALYQPDIIIITSDSLRGLCKKEFLHRDNVCSVQIDEASQVPEYNLLSLLASFPDSNFGLIGDIQQLPPYSDPLLDGKLKEFGIGDIMRRALKKRMFPRVDLLDVYRCHPVTTNLLSNLFYDGRLVSGVTAEERNEFMKNYRDIWPQIDFPIIVVDNDEPGYRMGTSFGNKAALISGNGARSGAGLLHK